MILKILTFVGNIRVYTTCVRSEKEKKDKKDESEAFAKHREEEKNQPTFFISALQKI